MPNPQGSQAVNTAYFTSMTSQVQRAKNCAELQSINLQVNVSVGGTLTALTAQLAAVEGTAQSLADQLVALANNIATLAGSQAAFTALGTLPSVAAAVSDLPSAIAYIKAEGPLLGTLGTSNAATFVQQAITLAKEVITITNTYNLLERQITSMTAQISQITSNLSSLQNILNAQASGIPGCAL